LCNFQRKCGNVAANVIPNLMAFGQYCAEVSSKELFVVQFQPSCIKSCCCCCCCCAYNVGESCFEVNIEADSYDITEFPHDDKPRPYLCTLCDKRLASRESLSIHTRAHSEENWYSCSQCDKCYSNLYSFKVHMNIHRSKYNCPECGKGSQSKQALAVHRRSHSGEKPFECTVCSKLFSTLGVLRKHSRIHSGEKPYKCHVCHKAFSQCSALNSHMRVHTGDEAYKCSQCRKSFTTFSRLQTHEHRVHSSRRSYDSHTIEMRTEADSNDITERSHDDTPTIGMLVSLHSSVSVICSLFPLLTCCVCVVKDSVVSCLLLSVFVLQFYVISHQRYCLL